MNMPVKVGDIKELKVEALGKEKDGIAKVEGFVVIVNKPVEVDKVYKVKVTKVLRRVAFSDVIKDE